MLCIDAKMQNKYCANKVTLKIIMQLTTVNFCSHVLKKYISHCKESEHHIKIYKLPTTVIIIIIPTFIYFNGSFENHEYKH